MKKAVKKVTLIVALALMVAMVAVVLVSCASKVKPEGTYNFNKFEITIDGMGEKETTEITENDALYGGMVKEMKGSSFIFTEDTVDMAFEGVAEEDPKTFKFENDEVTFVDKDGEVLNPFAGMTDVAGTTFTMYGQGKDFVIEMTYEVLSVKTTMRIIFTK